MAGGKTIIERIHRFRKMFGGGMRQAGILAAAAIYALDHHVDRLAEDHASAKLLAEAIAQMPGLVTDPAGVETNMVYFDVDPAAGTAASFCDELRAAGVALLPVAPQRVRAVTHLDAPIEKVELAIEAMERATKACLSSS